MSKFKVKMTSHPDVIKELEDWSEANEEVEINQPVEEHSGPTLGWELETVANIATIVTTVVYLGEMAASIYNSIRAHKSTISVQTAKGEVTVSWSDDLSIDDMRDILKHTLDED